MKRIIFIVLLVTTVPVTFSQNMVINPGFETWLRPNKPDGWVPAEKCLVDSLSVVSGKYCCLHTGSTTSRADLGQSIAVSAGKTYTFSFNSKTIAATGSGARIWCSWKNSTGSRIADPLTDNILQPSVFMKNESWQIFSISITAPDEAVVFYLEVRTYPNSTSYWDDFVFEESIPTHSAEILNSRLLVYPNPARNHLIINNISDIQHIDIYSITGIRKYSSDYSGQQVVIIPLTGLTNGAYIIRIRSSTGIIIRKFIKSDK